jgi:NAD-dependent histone deacetylase SIR2
VGGLGGRADDVLLLGECDTGVRKLADALGWLDELESLWKKTSPSVPASKDQKVPQKTREEKLEDEVEKLTQEIDKSLKVSEEHTAWLRDHLSDKHNLENESKKPPSAATEPIGTPNEANSAGSDGAEGKLNGEEKMSTPVLTQDDGQGGITHVYPYMDPKASGQLEKPSL